MVAPLVLLAAPASSWCRALAAALERRGAEVRLAATLREALRLIDGQKLELAIIDADLDPHHGYEIIDRIRQRHPKTAIMLLAATLEPALQHACERARSVDLVTKPLQAVSIVLDRAAHLLGDRLPTVGNRVPLVLCVDDDPLVLQSLERMISRRGYRVVTYSDPEKALDSLAQVGPDLAIVDVLMPDMNGLNLAGAIREASGGRIPVIVLSAVPEEEGSVKPFREDIDCYLNKPCAPETLLEVVDQFVGP